MDVQRTSSKVKMGRYFDFTLLVMVMFLLVFGLIMIYSTSYYTSALENNGDAFVYFNKQLKATILGLILMIITTFVPLKLYKKLFPIIYVVGVGTIFLVLTPLKHSANGATRWIQIFGFSVQPAEIVKAAIILSVAAVLSMRSSKELRGWSSVLWALVPSGIASVLILFLTQNLSSAIIVAGIAYVMLITVTKKNLIPYVILAAIVLLGLIGILCITKGWFSMGFRGERILAWLNPEAYADGKGFQILQSLYGIGSGGMWGKGPGNSMQKLGFLPEASNDMIFSVICEEFGLFGGLAVMLAYVVMLWRIRDISVYCKDLYSNLVVTGVFAQIALQVLFNIAVVTNTIPNTGISLPFISYGGSSIVILLAEMGFVFNVSRKAVFVKETTEEDSYDDNENDTVEDNNDR